MEERRTFLYISLDQAIVPVTMSGPQRTFVNCLPSIDLEMWFLGTIFCEIDDLDQTSPTQTLLQCKLRTYSMVFSMSILSSKSISTLGLKTVRLSRSSNCNRYQHLSNDTDWQTTKTAKSG